MGRISAKPKPEDLPVVIVTSFRVKSEMSLIPVPLHLWRRDARQRFISSFIYSKAHSSKLFITLKEE
jgi:hypothetical protein